MNNMTRRDFLKTVCAVRSLGVPHSVASERPASLDPANWMTTLPSDASLASLSMPGSHNSCARFDPFLPFGGGTTRCQDRDIGEQLRLGIRFLDVRCRHICDKFDIYHGFVSQNLTFASVQDACVDFLHAHSSETILMSV